MSKTLQFAITGSVLAFAILALQFSDEFAPWAWKLYYGDELKWHNLKIKISPNEHFRPVHGGKFLYIGDQDRTSLLILSPSDSSESFFRKRVIDFCPNEKCDNYSENVNQYGGRSILQIMFANPASKSDDGIFAFFCRHHSISKFNL